MKRAIAILTNNLYGGGSERAISRMSFQLIKKYKLYILSLEVTDKDYECAGTVINTGQEGGYAVRVLRTVLGVNKLVKKCNIECVISFLQMPDLINLVFNRSCARIVNLRAYTSFQLSPGITEKMKYLLCKWIYRKADYVIAVSSELAEDAGKRYGIPDSRLAAIENCYDSRKIEHEALKTINEDCRRFISLHLTAVAVGRLAHEKNYKCLLKIFKKVVEIIPEAGLLIIGDGKKTEDIRAVIEEYGLESNVYMTGCIKNPFSYMSKCSLYVSASLHEGFPNSLVEAMLCRLPVIHTACRTGPVEILSNHKIVVDKIEMADYGVLVPDFSQAGRLGLTSDEICNMFVNAWVGLLKDRKLAEQFSIKGYNRALEYSVERITEKYFNLLQKVIT